MHTGKQIYDQKNKYFITPKLFGSKKDPEAYWVNFDWDKASAAGMKISGLAYSGEYGFAPTEMYWRLNHMVTPADSALGCLDCHMVITAGLTGGNRATRAIRCGKNWQQTTMKKTFFH